jgi:hypothetical protein
MRGAQRRAFRCGALSKIWRVTDGSAHAFVQLCCTGSLRQQRVRHVQRGAHAAADMRRGDDRPLMSAEGRVCAFKSASQHVWLRTALLDACSIFAPLLRVLLPWFAPRLFRLPAGAYSRFTAAVAVHVAADAHARADRSGEG